jgi:hypothetical protein
MFQILSGRKRLCTVAAFRRFWRLIFPLLTAMFVATVGDSIWELILHISALVRFHFLHLTDPQVFRAMLESRIKRVERSLPRGSWRTSHV